MDKKRKQEQVWVWRGAVIALAVVAVIISIVAIVLGAIAFGNYGNFNAAVVVTIAGAVPPSPYALYLDQAATPLHMTLPTDLGDRVGNVYRVWSRTAQPHTVTIAGGTGTTWDGANTVATFGGAIGDGFVYEVRKTAKRFFSQKD